MRVRIPPSAPVKHIEAYIGARTSVLWQITAALDYPLCLSLAQYARPSVYGLCPGGTGKQAPNRLTEYLAIPLF